MISKIEKSIKEYKKIALFFHEKPDVDCLASCFAFMKFIKNKFPQKHVVIIGVKDFLGENSDFYANSLFENTSIKNIVNDDDFLKDSLGIILDTANSSRIYNQKYDACARIIVIDHHPIPEQDPTVGAIEWKNPVYSACCEMLAKLFFKWDKHAVSKDVAKYLYAGIVTDTGRFLYPNTTSKTLKIASKLCKINFDRKSVYDSLYSVSVNDIEFDGYVKSLIKFNKSKDVAWVNLPKGSFEKYNVPKNTNFVGKLGNIIGVEVWATLYYDAEKEEYSGSLRSKQIPINGIAAKYDGGGHELASGFKIKNAEDFDKVIDDIEKIVKEKKTT